MIDIQDIVIEDRAPRWDYINISFEGQVDSKNCVNDTSSGGTIRIKILSEGNETEVTANLTSRTDIERGDEEDLPCEEIVVERKVRIDGKLGIGENRRGRLSRNTVNRLAFVLFSPESPSPPW